MTEDMEKRMVVLEGRVNELDKNMGVFGVYIDGAQKTQDKLSGILDKLNDSLNELKLTLLDTRNDNKNNTKSIIDVKDDMSRVERNFEGKMMDFRTSVNCDIENIKKDVDTVKTEVKVVDDKGKFDFISFIRDHAPDFIFGGATAYLLSLLMETLAKKP